MDEVKQMVSEVPYNRGGGVPPQRMRLMSGLRIMHDGRSLSDYNIHRYSYASFLNARCSAVGTASECRILASPCSAAHLPHAQLERERERERERRGTHSSRTAYVLFTRGGGEIMRGWAPQPSGRRSGAVREERRKRRHNLV